MATRTRGSFCKEKWQNLPVVHHVSYRITNNFPIYILGEKVEKCEDMSFDWMKFG
jgi:hypothetical protein